MSWLWKLKKHFLSWLRNDRSGQVGTGQYRPGQVRTGWDSSGNVLHELTQETKKVLAKPTQETKIKLLELAQETENTLPELGQE